MRHAAMVDEREMSVVIREHGPEKNPHAAKQRLLVEANRHENERPRRIVEQRRTSIDGV